MPVSVKVGGVWKTATNVYNKVGGVWKTATDMPVKVGGVWKTGVLIQGAYESIASTVLGANAASVSFSSIPSTYKHLQIRFTGLTPTNNTNNGILYLRLNSDSGANYSFHSLGTQTGTGTADIVTSANATDMMVGYVRGPSGGDLRMTVAVIDILDYASTSKRKTVSTFSGFDTNNNGQKMILGSGNWRSNSAVNSITIGVRDTGINDNLRSATVVSLYGIKG